MRPLCEFHSLVETIGKFFVEALLQLHRAPCIQGDLDEDAFARAMNAKIVTIKGQVALGMFSNHLKAIMLGNIEHIYQGLVDSVADLSTIFL
jgi:hypothetical protein